jgi:hypothetical protein
MQLVLRARHEHVIAVEKMGRYSGSNGAGHRYAARYFPSVSRRRQLKARKVPRFEESVREQGWARTATR